MKNLIAILAILLVVLAPVALAEENGDASDSEDKSPREKAKERMENAKSNIAERKEMREERKQMRLETREEIRALRESVKAACEADKNSEECKTARMDARDAKHTLLGRIAEKMGPTFKRAEMLKTRLARILAHLERKGKDVSGLDTGAINAKITEAQAIFDEAKKLFEQARAAEAGEKDELMKQAAQKFREANKALKEARALIVDWLKSVKQKDANAVEESASTAPADVDTTAPAADANATSATNVTSSTDSDDSEDESEDDESEDADEGNASSQVNASTNGTTA